MLWTLELASFFTHRASYCPVPQTSMPLSATNFMTSLPAESILEHGASFLFQRAVSKVQLFQFLMNQYSSLRHLSVRLGGSLLSVMRKFQVLIAIEPKPSQMDEIESEKSLEQWL